LVTRSTPTVSAAVDQYLTSRASWYKPRTLESVRSNLLRFAAAHPFQVGRLESHHVEAWMTDYGSRVQASTFNVVRGRVTDFLEFCRGRGWIKGNLMAEVRRRQVQQKERRRLDAQELLALLDCAATPRDRAMLAFAMNTGCRASEITAVRLKHLDLDKQECELVISKSGKADLMPLTADLLPELVRWLAVYEAEAGKLEGEWFLFPAKDTPKFIGKGKLGERVWKPLHPVSMPELVVTRALSTLGWTDTRGEGFHTIRRSVGRIYFDAASARGHDGALRETSALLHHSNVSTTEQYLGITAERRKRDEVMRGQRFLSRAAAEQAKLEVVDRGTDSSGTSSV
jgi:integrase